MVSGERGAEEGMDDPCPPPPVLGRSSPHYPPTPPPPPQPWLPSLGPHTLLSVWGLRSPQRASPSCLALHPFTALLCEVAYFALWVSVHAQASVRGDHWLCPKAYSAGERRRKAGGNHRLSPKTK